MATLVAMVVVLWAVAPQEAQAIVIVEWSFDDPAPTVGPFDVVSMDATISNDSTSDESIDLGASIIEASFINRNLLPPYDDLSFGPLGCFCFFAQFDGIVLDPGDSFGFGFGTLTPGPTPVPAGVYRARSTSLSILGISQHLRETNGPFTVTVAEAPEPGVLGLLGTGLVVLVGYARRRGR